MRQASAALAVMVLLLSGCAEAKEARKMGEAPTVSIPGGGPSIELPPSRDIKDLVVVGFDTSASGVEERPFLLDQLVKVVVPEAARRRAFVEVTLVGARAYNGTPTIAQLDFRPPSDNPNEIRDSQASAGTKLAGAITGALRGRAPDQASDPVGFLRRVADRVTQFPKAHVVSVYVGDGASSIEQCDLGLLPVDAASVDRTAAECVARTGGVFRLPGVEAWLLGVGLDFSGGLDTARAVGIRQVLTAIVVQAGGKVTRAGVDGIGGAR